MMRDRVTLKDTTGCTKGYVGIYDTDGYSHATQTLADTVPCKVVVFAETVVAPISGHATALVTKEGEVVVAKVNDTVFYEGEMVGLSTEAGKVTTLAVASIAKYGIGYTVAPSDSGDTTVKVRIGSAH